MITQIGIISGRILELLDQSNGALVFGDIHSSLRGPRDVVLMSLGWLLRKGYIHIIEDPLRSVYQDDDRKKVYSNEACMFDLVVGNSTEGIAGKRIKNMPDRIAAVAGRILALLEGCGGLLALQTIECNLKESRDSILMGLGWLIREGCVRGIIGTHEIFIFRLSDKTVCPESEAFFYA